MTRALPFGLTIPVLYVNPALNANASLIREVHDCGGIGFVDHYNPGAVEFPVPQGIAHGVRISLRELGTLQPDPDLRLVMIPLEEARSVASLTRDSFSQAPAPVLVEVGSPREAEAAEQAGAAGLVARGNEGPGWVSETSGFVLLQEILPISSLPVFLRGGVGPHTAAGALGAGACGVVLDVHLLLSSDSALEPSLKTFLGTLGAPATVVLGESRGMCCRVYGREGTRMVREIRNLESSLSQEGTSFLRSKIEDALSRPARIPDVDETLLCLSEDIAIARNFADEHHRARSMIRTLSRSMHTDGYPWPFGENSPVCVAHGTRYPLVQGPMAQVSEGPEFLAKVLAGGALPFLALGNMDRSRGQEAIKLAAAATNGTFGVGVIGLDVNRENYEAHLAIMSQDPPRFAILAGGSVSIAQRIEAMGTVCYFHCPTPAVLAEALRSGLRHFVFEGSESGGHIGSLGSLDLWTANLRELAKAEQEGISLRDVVVLFAGGIGSGRASAFVAGMTAESVSRGLKVGLQMGTAYLATSEAVSTRAITPTYRRLVRETDRTVIIGTTVKARARAGDSPMASTLVTRERKRVEDRMPLRERKALFERDNVGALRLAAKGCASVPPIAGSDRCEWMQVSPEEQFKRGLYLMGQVASILKETTSIDDLHQNVLGKGRFIFEGRVPGERERPLGSVSSCRTAGDQGIVPKEGAEENPASRSPRAADSANGAEPIAVVGIGLLFPGSRGADVFWQNIIHGVSSIMEVPEGRWDDTDYYYDPDPRAPDKTYSRIGGFVTDFAFDPLPYRIPPAVARKMDRTQQMAVVAVADALADARLSAETLRGQRVGVFIGNSMGGESTELYAVRVRLPLILSRLEASLAACGLDRDAMRDLSASFLHRYLKDLPDITEDSLPGELAGVISGRIANVFGLEGPNFTVDAACASSLAALAHACQELGQNSIDCAISGGVDSMMHPSSFIKFCKVGALSSRGSRPFDESADGFVMGEGAGIVVLKRLSDAIRDHDRIYCTVKGSGASSDGRGKGITAPNANGQFRAIRSGFAQSNLNPKDIGLIEAHGTSTAVGDAVELSVLDRFLRDAGVPAGSVGLGSVKSQIGHLKAAAGAAGIVKAALSIYHKTLPPTINIGKPSSAIEWGTSPLFLVRNPLPWASPPGVPRRAGVSAFGFGGTNFHVLLQEHIPSAPDSCLTKRDSLPVRATPDTCPGLSHVPAEGDAWLIGARSRDELIRKADEMVTLLHRGDAPFTASDCREDASLHDVRCGFVAKDRHELEEKLGLIRDSLRNAARTPVLRSKGIQCTDEHEHKACGGVGYLFPGQGSQYPHMLREMAAHFPVVSDTLREADEILVSLGVGPVTDVMLHDLPTTRLGDRTASDAIITDTGVLQPMILAADIAVFRLLEQMGLRPSACAGHSLGEYAACVAAGVLSFRDALEVVAVRGREMSQVTMADPGLMVSLPLDVRAVEPVLSEVNGYAVVANKNSPRQTVISGRTEAVRNAVELFRKRGVEAIILPVSAAFHSRVVLPAQDALKKVLQRVTFHPPLLPIFSNVTGEAYPSGPAARERIRDLLAEQLVAPVEWVKSLQSMYAEGVRIFMECGPKCVLTGLAGDTLPDDVLLMPSIHPRKGEVRQFMETITFLAAEGVKVDFPRSTPKALPVIVGLKPVPETREPAPQASALDEPGKAGGLQGLLDDELETLSSHHEFAGFLERQGEPIRALIKSSFKAYLDVFVPLEKTVREVRREGMDFQPVVINGAAVGLPSDIRFPFDRQNLEELIMGRNFIQKVPEKTLAEMVEKNIDRLIKDHGRGAEFKPVVDYRDVIRLAACFSDADLMKEYGLDARLADSTDVTTRFAIAAGIEALKDAGIPLIRGTRVTGTGDELPDAWALPESLRADTGVIFVSCFPGLASAVTEVTREQKSRYGAAATKRLIDRYTGLVGRIRDEKERKEITKWFTQEFGRMDAGEEGDQYKFARDFVLKVMPMAHGLFAQLIKAQGPNTHIHAGCAGTTQAILLARDWIRTGQARRVIVIAADDVAGETLLPWVGSGFLAMGAATTEADVSRAALPFDERRSGVILGSAALGFVLEKAADVADRGMEPYASIEAGMTANSAFHGTRLDAEHISHIMAEVVSLWERQTGLTRRDLARDMFFMSHETYSPKRGGSSAAEIQALRNTFGPDARTIPITNTKGFTGHTMAVGVEDVVALRCLQKGILPRIANLSRPDPDFADMNLSRGGHSERSHVLRLAAGFGSQIVITLYKRVCRSENRITDLPRQGEWLKRLTGYGNPLSVEDHRALRVVESPITEPQQGKGSAPAWTESASLRGPTRQDEVMGKILGLLSARTGYPPEMLGPGLDLEADLGIDTVKQAEFIADIRKIFGLPRIEGLNITEFPTIEHIVRFVVARTSETPTPDEEDERCTRAEGNSVPARWPQPTMNTPHPSSEERPAPRPSGDGDGRVSPGVFTGTLATAEEIRVYETRLVPLGEAEVLSLPEVDRVIITGGTRELADEIELMLRSIGCSAVERRIEATLPQELIGTRLGVVNLFPTTDKSLALNRTFQLFQSCTKVSESGPSFFVTMVCEDGAFGFDNPQPQGHVDGAVAGAVKAFAREYPSCRTRLLDIHPDLDASRSARLVVESLCRQVPVEVAVGRGGEQRVIRLVPVQGRGGQDPVSREEVVLVTGGAKGITASCLRRLVEICPLRLVLLGRTPLSDQGEKYAGFSAADWEAEKTRIIENLRSAGSLPTPAAVDRELDLLRSVAEVHATIRDLQALGSHVIYRETDIRDKESVSAVVSEIKGLYGRIDVMVHAAGIEKSLPLKRKSAEDMESVVSVKIGGMNNFLQAFQEHGIFPGKILGFGSVAGRFGNAAQVDYAAANDGLAHLLRWVGRSTGAHAWIIDWGPWAGGGMASRGSARNALEAAGIDFIPREAGTHIFCRSLTEHAMGSEVVVAGRLGPFSPEAFEVPGTPAHREVHLARQSAHVTRFLPREYLRARVMLDPSHPLLDHHRIKGVAVLPGVGGMEIMRGAAGVLNPECLRACLQDVRFSSPIKVFGHEPFEAFVEVVRARGSNRGCDTDAASSGGAPPHYTARIFSWFLDKKGARVGSERLHQECVLRLEDRQTEPFPPDAYPGDQCTWMMAKDVYAVFFHGPGFRFLEWVSVHDRGKCVRFCFADTTDRGRMFGQVTPALVETVFQAAAVGGLEYRGVMALPTGIGRCTVKPDLQSKGYVSGASGLVVLREECAAPGADPERSALVYDAVVRDAEGKELLTLSGLEMVPAYPGKGFAGKVFEEVVRLDQVIREGDGELQPLEDKILCLDEAAEYRTKLGVPKRAAEWLAGRVAAKRSVQRLLAQSNGAVTEITDLCISVNGHGMPKAHLARHPERKVADVSISHSHGVAMAAATLPGIFEGLGIDLEKVDQRSENWVNDSFTPWEIRTASHARDRNTFLTATWALKEAAAKALGTGLAFDLRDIAVVQMDPSGRVQLELKNEAAHYFETHFTGTLEAMWEEWGSMVRARVVIR